MFRIVIVSTILFWLVSCVPSQNIFVEDIPNHTWVSDIEITYPNSDTTSLRDIYLIARYTPKNLGQNLGFKLKITDPSGNNIVDSITMKIVQTDKNYQQSKMLYRSHSCFKTLGNYTFTFSPLTSHAKQQNIAAVGIIID